MKNDALGWCSVPSHYPSPADDGSLAKSFLFQQPDMFSGSPLTSVESAYSSTPCSQFILSGLPLFCCNFVHHSIVFFFLLCDTGHTASVHPLFCFFLLLIINSSPSVHHLKSQSQPAQQNISASASSHCYWLVNYACRLMVIVFRLRIWIINDIFNFG